MFKPPEYCGHSGLYHGQKADLTIWNREEQDQWCSLRLNSCVMCSCSVGEIPDSTAPFSTHSWWYQFRGMGLGFELNASCLQEVPIPLEPYSAILEVGYHKLIAWLALNWDPVNLSLHIAIITGVSYSYSAGRDHFVHLKLHVVWRNNMFDLLHSPLSTADHTL
jgi:hypothetical protein